jgi:hypothetical protein
LYDTTVVILLANVCHPTMVESHLHSIPQGVQWNAQYFHPQFQNPHCKTRALQQLLINQSIKHSSSKAVTENYSVGGKQQI